MKKSFSSIDQYIDFLETENEKLSKENEDLKDKIVKLLEKCEGDPAYQEIMYLRENIGKIKKIVENISN